MCAVLAAPHCCFFRLRRKQKDNKKTTTTFFKPGAIAEPCVVSETYIYINIYLCMCKSITCCTISQSQAVFVKPKES